MAPSRVAPGGRPPVPLDAAVRAVAGPAQLSVSAAPVPASGGTEESEAVRRYVRSRYFALEGDDARATDNLDAALRLDPGSAALRSVRAELAARGGDLRRAVAEWEAVLASDPDDVRALVALGLAAHESGAHPRAVEMLGRAWPRLAEGGFPALSDAGRAAIGGALARSLFRTGFDSAGLEVAPVSLSVSPARVAEQRGDGLDAASRSMAALARESAEAAFRVRRPDVAARCARLASALEPSARAGALEALAWLRSGDGQGARAALDAVLATAPWEDPAATAQAEWMLRAVGADGAAEARERLALAALSADARIAGSPAAPAAQRSRLARLLAAAGDGQGGAALLSRSLADGDRDPLALEAAFLATGDRGAPALASDLAARLPRSLGAVAEAMLRASRDARTLRQAVEDLPPGPARESLAAALLAAMRAPGDAWRRAEAAAAAHEESRLPLEAMVLAAVAANDPSLVARAAAAAFDAVDTDPWWQAALAAAYADTGAPRDAQQSAARAELFAGDPAPGSPLAVALAAVRARVDGQAPAGSPRSRAEAALRAGDTQGAVDELLLARAVDPGDAAALGMLVRLLPRSEGGEGARAWLTLELAERPNEPMLWEALALADVAGGRAADALSRIDRRLAADPDDPMVLRGREAALRALGRADEALAAGRGRIASLPAGPRLALEEAELAAASGDAEGALQALVRFSESAFRPPASMSAAALEVARRLPASAPGRGAAMRAIARDAIASDPRSPLEFYAFDALGAALERPGGGGGEAASGVAAEAAAVPELRMPGEPWRAATDFLLAQGQPAVAAEFARARLLDPGGLTKEEISILARAAVACDAVAGGRARQAMDLLAQLASAGHRPFGAEARPASAYDALAGSFESLGDLDGADRIREAGLAVDPTDPGLLNNLGYARLERGIADARTAMLLEAALAARPEDSGTVDSFGWLQYLRGRFADDASGPGAVTLLRRAAGLTRGSPSAVQLDHLGDALWRSGDREAARASWAAAASAADPGIGRERHLELLGRVFRQRTGLGGIDVARYHDANDGAVAARARAKTDAAAAGREPAVAPLAAEASPLAAEASPPAAEASPPGPGAAPRTDDAPRVP
jgi:Tfp pilus assembly protein PilF